MMVALMEELEEDFDEDFSLVRKVVEEEARRVLMEFHPKMLEEMATWNEISGMVETAKHYKVFPTTRSSVIVSFTRRQAGSVNQSKMQKCFPNQTSLTERPSMKTIFLRGCSGTAANGRGFA